MIGVSFQPGSQEFGQQQSNGGGRPQGQGLQEAIRVLSLRLPKVLGAQPAASMPLLTAQGGGGNPRVDSIVQQVLARIMPQGQPMQTAAPSVPPMSGPSFSGSASPHQQQQAPSLPNPWAGGTTPRVTVDNPLGFGDFVTGEDGRPMGPTPGLIGQLPPNFQFPEPTPQPAPDWGRIGSLLGGGGGYGGGSREPEFF